MPFQESIRPLKFDKYHMQSYADWEKYEWNNRIKRCGRIDLEHCQKVAFTDPVDRLQFKPNFTGDNLLETTHAYTGEVDSVSPGFVVATGIGNNASTGNLLYAVGGASTIITGVTDADTVAVAADVFLAGDEIYRYNYVASGTEWMVEQANGTIFTKSSSGASSLVSVTGITEMDKWYYFRFEITGYVSGEMNLTGVYQLHTFDTNGFHEVYVKANNTNIGFVCSGAQDFVGSIRLDSFELYAVNTEEIGVTMDVMGNVIDYGPIPFVEDALESGVFMADIPLTWGELLGEECQCFHFSIFSSPCYTKNQIQWEKDTECWDTDEGITVNSGAQSLIFENAVDGAQADYTCDFTCPIVCGEEYIISYSVSGYVGGAVDIVFAGGVFIADGPGDYSFNFTPGGSCIGLDTFSVTAVDPFATTVTLTLEAITITKVPVGVDADLVSERFCMCDELPCELVVDYRHRINIYGFAYEGEELANHRNRLRFCGELTKSAMVSNDYQVFKSSPGWYSTAYANLDEAEYLETELMPPYLANALTVAMAHNDVLIDGVPYTMKEFAQSSGQENTELVQVNLLVVKKDQTETFTYSA